MVESSFIHPSSLPACPVALSDSEVLGMAWFPSESSCGAPLCAARVFIGFTELIFNWKKTSGNPNSALELGLWHSCGDFSPVHTGTSSDGTSKFHSLGGSVDPGGISWTFRALLTSKLFYFQSFN